MMFRMKIQIKIAIPSCDLFSGYAEIGQNDAMSLVCRNANDEEFTIELSKPT